MKPILLFGLFLLCSTAHAQERLCDPQLEDCREPLLELIRTETQGIDVAFWEMNDSRYASALIKRYRAGVPVRILFDRLSTVRKAKTSPIVQQLIDAGIPLRQKVSPGILHWKLMLFHGQNVVEFSKANFSPYSFVAGTPGADWIDEAIYFTSDDRLTNSFRRAFDDRWTDPVSYAHYANIHWWVLGRRYPFYPLAPELNFAPRENFGARALPQYAQETQQIDVIMYRINDVRHVDAMIAAVARGVTVRILVEPDWSGPFHRTHVAQLAAAGVHVRQRAHRGQTHEALTVLHSLQAVVFGTGNWADGPSEEVNLFYHPGLGKPWFFQWFVDQFERKWTNEAAFVPFR